MTRPRRIALFLRVVWELLRYDLVVSIYGFKGVRGRLGQLSKSQSPADSMGAICRAVESAASFYWKRVRCLQRSAVAVRVLRCYGFPGELVIGCTPAPFFSHAWVEVEGRILNGSPTLSQDLRVLDRI